MVSQSGVWNGLAAILHGDRLITSPFDSGEAFKTIEELLCE